MNLVAALLLVLVLAWLLGIGHMVHFSATLQAGGGLQTLLVLVLIAALVTMLFRSRRFRW